MADLTITAANIAISNTNARAQNVVGGAAIAIGEVVYLDTDGKYKLADNTTAAKSAAVGFAITKCSGDGVQFLMMPFTSELVFTPGAPLTPGATYYVSGTAGKICPFADLGSGDYVTPLFVASTAALAQESLTPTGTAL